jgi:hypothetical protein
LRAQRIGQALHQGGKAAEVGKENGSGAALGQSLLLSQRLAAVQRQVGIK